MFLATLLLGRVILFPTIKRNLIDYLAREHHLALNQVEIGGSLPVRVEVPSTGDTRIFRLGDRVRVEVSSETVVLVPEA